MQLVAREIAGNLYGQVFMRLDLRGMAQPIRPKSSGMIMRLVIRCGRSSNEKREGVNPRASNLQMGRGA